jgi:O-antigen/teichoic acid export membrane protein
MKESLPIGMISLSGMLYTYLDSIILSLLQPMEVVGWYSAAYRLMLVLLFIPTAVNVAVFPVMSKYFLSAPDALKLLYERYFKLMIIIGIPIGFGTIVLANKFILLIFGPAYTNSTIALQILVWTMVFTFAGASFVQLFMATNRQLFITKISLICVVINLILNLTLIPKFSYVGASFATVITEIILVSYLIRAAYKFGYGLSRDVGSYNIFKVILSSIIMSIFIWYFQSFNLLILIVSALIIYIGTLYLLRGIDKVDLEIINKITKGE